MSSSQPLAGSPALCGLLALGGTRRSFVFSQNRHAADPGKIDYAAYAQFVLDRYLAILTDYFSLGGTVAVMRLMDRSIYVNRGDAYADMALNHMRMLADQQALAAYDELGCGVAFAGLEDVAARDSALAERLRSVERKGERCVVWEVGTPDGAHEPVLPPADFYLGSSQSGDLKMRFPLPTPLHDGQPLRLFFTPYPSLLITRIALQNIITALTEPQTRRSTGYDWQGRFTTEEAEAEYAAIQRQIDANVVLGV